MLKRALFAGAALVIGVTYMQGAVTPALAGPNVKPKVTVKPRIRVVKPKIRLKIRPQRLPRKMQEKNTTDPTKLQARKVEQPTVKVTADQIFQAMLGDFLVAATAAKEAAEAAEAARRAKDFDIAIVGLVPVDPKEGLTGDGGGNAGNNKGPIDMSPGEFADRFGASKTAREAEDAGLADRFGAPSSGSSAVGDWSKSTGIAPDYTTIPTGGLASTETSKDTEGNTTTIKYVQDDGTVLVTRTTRVVRSRSGTDPAVTSRAQFRADGSLLSTSRTTTFRGGYSYTTGRDWEYGIARSTDNRGQTYNWNFNPATGLDRTQTGEEQTTSTLPMPSCGSATCNAWRRSFGIRSLATAGTRTNPGPDGGTPNPQGPSVSALINQDDLVKTNVAGDAANSERNRTARELKDKGVRY